MLAVPPVHLVKQLSPPISSCNLGRHLIEFTNLRGCIFSDSHKHASACHQTFYFGVWGLAEKMQYCFFMTRAKNWHLYITSQIPLPLASQAAPGGSFPGSSLPQPRQLPRPCAQQPPISSSQPTPPGTCISARISWVCCVFSPA